MSAKQVLISQACSLGVPAPDCSNQGLSSSLSLSSLSSRSTKPGGLLISLAYCVNSAQHNTLSWSWSKQFPFMFATNSELTALTTDAAERTDVWQRWRSSTDAGRVLILENMFPQSRPLPKRCWQFNR